MAAALFPGFSIPAPSLQGVGFAGDPEFFAMAIAATGEKASFNGRVWFQERTGTKAIQTIGFLFGTVVKAGGSGLTVSLQNPSVAAGRPMQPDETQDQTVAIANGAGTFLTDTWHQTGNLSANRTVNFGELLSIVVEYNGSGRLGSDTVQIKGLTQLYGTHQGMSTLKTGGSWVSQVIIPNVILGFSDGTFGTLAGGFPCSAIGSVNVNSGSAGSDEYALEFSFPGPVSVDAGAVLSQGTTGSDYELLLYNDTTVLQTVAIDAFHQHSTGNTRMSVPIPFPAAQALSASTNYLLAVRPTSGQFVQIHYFDVAAAGHLQAHSGGQNWRLRTRLNQGAWAAATATRRPFFQIYVSAIDDGAGGGGGGGMIVHPGMSGGIRG